MACNRRTGDNQLVKGNTAANGTFTITVGGPSTLRWRAPPAAAPGPEGACGVACSACLAPALNASIADVEAIATALGATAPSLPATRPGTLADMAMLAAIAAALDVVARYGISGPTLVQLAGAAPDTDTASAAMGAFQSQYPQSAWLGAVQPVEDALRQAAATPWWPICSGPADPIAGRNS